MRGGEGGGYPLSGPRAVWSATVFQLSFWRFKLLLWSCERTRVHALVALIWFTIPPFWWRSAFISLPSKVWGSHEECDDTPLVVQWDKAEFNAVVFLMGQDRNLVRNNFDEEPPISRWPPLLVGLSRNVIYTSCSASKLMQCNKAQCSRFGMLYFLNQAGLELVMERLKKHLYPPNCGML